MSIDLEKVLAAGATALDGVRECEVTAFGADMLPSEWDKHCVEAAVGAVVAGSHRAIYVYDGKLSAEPSFSESVEGRMLYEAFQRGVRHHWTKFSTDMRRGIVEFLTQHGYHTVNDSAPPRDDNDFILDDWYDEIVASSSGGATLLNGDVTWYTLSTDDSTEEERLEYNNFVEVLDSEMWAGRGTSCPAVLQGVEGGPVLICYNDMNVSIRDRDALADLRDLLDLQRKYMCKAGAVRLRCESNSLKMPGEYSEELGMTAESYENSLCTSTYTLRIAIALLDIVEKWLP